MLEVSLFHAVAEALVRRFDLERGGTAKQNGELAVILLVEAQESDDMVSLKALRQFGLATLPDIAGDFWSERNMGSAYFEESLCLLVGSDPRRYRLQTNRLPMTLAQVDKCVDAYGMALASWLEPLLDYLRQGGNLIRL